MSQITITRALAELKLLDSRISDKIVGSIFILANKKSAKKVNGIYTREEFESKVKADYQSVRDLVQRRKIIKSAIVESNANTEITIANETMTVADAIERKASIQYEKTLLNHLESQLRNQTAKLESENSKAQVGLDNLLNTSFGRDNRGKATEDEINAIAKPYLEQNEWEMINPLKLQDIIEALKTNIENFLTEVDFILSESNTITKIEIPE